MTGWVPLSLFELLIMAFVVRQLVGGGVAAWDVARKRRNGRNAAAAGALRLGQDLGIVVTLFYLLWGFNYVRVPLDTRMGLPALSDSVTAEDVGALTAGAVDSVNAAYRRLHGRDDAGRPTRGTRADRAPLYAALNASWQTAADSFGLGAPAAWRYGRPKSALFGAFFRRAGISGMYAPFTGEALVVGDLPAMSFARSVAHEQAHQRGTAHEMEASFLAWLITTRAEHPHARYSGHADAAARLLAVLRRADRRRWRAEWNRIIPGVRRDYEDLEQYWVQFDGPLEAVGERVNDAFLRTNRVEEGVVAYSRAVELLIAFQRRNAVSSGPSP